ncbi:hypothetical protein HPB49_023537 [Dermacentor silvarum]|uniref:Uncharacterized protein n=1 Tax=Dermacentor silvarum TaxID=543639 RepID=A0ACB8C618_DERSI|nr:hypothetical protein HPB49_023537 [Dermacentor silvarum]
MAFYRRHRINGQSSSVSVRHSFDIITGRLGALHALDCDQEEEEEELRAAFLAGSGVPYYREPASKQAFLTSMTEPTGSKKALLQNADEESQVTNSSSIRTDRHHRNRARPRHHSSRHWPDTNAQKHETGARADELALGQPHLQAPSHAMASISDHVGTDSPDSTAHGRNIDVPGSDAGSNHRVTRSPGSSPAPKDDSRSRSRSIPETPPEAITFFTDPQRKVDTGQTPGNPDATRDVCQESCTDINQALLTTTALCVDNALPSPSAIMAFDKAPCSKTEQSMPSPSTMRESYRLPQKGFVRFGGTTLREFIPLTTLTDKIGRSPAIYGSIGALAALAIVALAVMFWSSDPKRHLHDECGSDDCRDAYGYLDSLLDSAIDPCTDFYQHVCRRWHIGNIDGATLAKVAAREVVDELHSTLLRKGVVPPGESDDPSARAEALLVRFHAACGSFIAASAHSDAAKRLVREYRSDSDVLQLRSTAEALRRIVQLSLERGISTLFKVRLIRHSDSEVALYVSRGQTLAEKLADPGHSSALVEFFKEALEEASEIPGAGIRKSEVNATISELLRHDVRTALRGAGLPTAEKVNASDFAVILDEAEPQLWLQFVNSMLTGDYRINKQTPVMCQELSLVRAAVELLEKNRRIGLIYIFIHIAMEVGRFYYRNKLLYDKPREAEVICMAASQDVMGHAWLSVFLNMTQALLPAESRAWPIFASVRSMSTRRLLDAGLDEAGKEGVRTALEDVTLIAQYGYSSSFSSLTANASVPSSVQYDTNFASYYTALKALEAVRRLQDPPSLEEVLVGESLFAHKTTYSGLLNAVLLPPAMQRPPLLYSTKVPLEFDMGTVGVLLSKALFTAGLPSARIGEPWYNLNVKEFVDCVQHSVSSASFVNTANLTIRQGLELFAWARAVRIAHDVMKNRYSGSGADQGYADIWANAQRTFFRRFCLLTCSAKNAGHESRLRCLVPLLNMVEFTRAFECPSAGLLNMRPCFLFLGIL